MNGDREITDLLRTRANDVPPSAGIPGPVLRRSRRRRALTASVVSVALVIAGAGALAGVQALTDRSRIPPAEEGPRGTERIDDHGSSERRAPLVLDPSDMSMVETASGTRPDDSAWSLQVGRAGKQYCAELGPPSATTCWSKDMMSDRFPLDLLMQGSSSDNRFQFLFGVADAEVARVEMRLSKPTTHDGLVLHRTPSGLGTDGRFFVAFPPKRSDGSVVAFDSADNEVARVRFPRAMQAGAASCEGIRGGNDPAAWSGPLLLGALGPFEFLATSFTALWSAGSEECEAAARQIPGRADGTKE